MNTEDKTVTAHLNTGKRLVIYEKGNLHIRETRIQNPGVRIQNSE